MLRESRSAAGNANDALWEEWRMTGAHYFLDVNATAA
jgi:hypothetical protein